MPTADLLNSCRVEVDAERPRGLAAESTRVLFAACREEIHTQRTVVRDGLVPCLACEGAAYDAPARRSATWRRVQIRTEGCKA
jgi:hypothetical protein